MILCILCQKFLVAKCVGAKNDKYQVCVYDSLLRNMSRQLIKHYQLMRSVLKCDGGNFISAVHSSVRIPLTAATNSSSDVCFISKNFTPITVKTHLFQGRGGGDSSHSPVQNRLHLQQLGSLGSRRTRSPSRSGPWSSSSRPLLPPSLPFSSPEGTPVR